MTWQILSIVLRVAEPGVVYGASDVGAKKAKDDQAQRPALCLSAGAIP